MVVMEREKIGIFTETFLPQINGVAISIYNMNRELVKRGYNVDVFTTGEKNEVMDGYHVYRFKSITFKPYPEFKVVVPTPKVWSFLKSRNLDACHSRSPFVTGVLAKMLTKKRIIPLVSTYDTPVFDYVHYMPFGSFGPAKSVFSSLAKRYIINYYNSCDAVVAPSETAKNQLVYIGCKKEINVVSNGIDINKFRPDNFSARLKKSICPNNEFFILHVGRVSKEKRVNVLLDAAEDMIKNGIRFKMIVIGRGPEKHSLEMDVRNRKLSENVCFLGYQPESELLKYYATAGLFVTASPVETEGIVLLEAMASGLPVVGVNRGSIPEIVKDGKNGLIAEFETGAGLAEKIEVCMSLKINAMKKRCREMAEQYSIQAVTDKLERVYANAHNNVM